MLLGRGFKPARGRAGVGWGIGVPAEPLHSLTLLSLQSHAAMGAHSTRAWPELLALLGSAWLWVGSAQPTLPSPTHAPAPQLRFRLAGYPRKHNEGRIEVFYNDEWGTICDDDFTLGNAHVLCRHLGFVAATGWAHSAKYGKGVGRIWLDNVNCAGSEKSIGDCKHRGWGNSDCSHEEDAGVVCKDERIAGFKDSNVIEVRNHVEEVRLRPVVSGGRRQLPVTEGIVEVRYKDSWAQICDQGWDSHNRARGTGVLGFAGLCRLFTERQQLNYRLHSVSCTGTEVHLSMCSFEFYRGNASAACGAGMPAVVSCVPGPLFATGNSHKKKQRQQQQQQQQQQGQPRIRLKGGAKIGEGRVEVLRSSEWGTICDDRWNLQSASVVCRELGFGSAKEALTGARMGQGERARARGGTCLGCAGRVPWALCCWMHMEHPKGTVAMQAPSPGSSCGGWSVQFPLRKDARVALGIPVSPGPESCCPLAGTGPIHLNEVQCRGTEKSLWSCPFRNITQEDCKHSEDAAVRCNIPYMGYENLVRATGGCQWWGPRVGCRGRPMGPTAPSSLLCTPHIFPCSGASAALGAQGFCGWEFRLPLQGVGWRGRCGSSGCFAGAPL
uniref:Lysyl oxidase like 3 n=1 Tax=Malurus cyaneus samueli TaxID=2593467 RepID=A0A8C5TRM1_9PASS